MTINHLVPDRPADRATNSGSNDNPDYIDNPTQQHFSYTGYTRVLTLQGLTKDNSRDNSLNKVSCMCEPHASACREHSQHACAHQPASCIPNPCALLARRPTARRMQILFR